MISGFVFNQDIVIHMLLVAAVVCAFVIAAVLTIFLVKLVERNMWAAVRVFGGSHYGGA